MSLNWWASGRVAGLYAVKTWRGGEGAGWDLRRGVQEEGPPTCAFHTDFLHASLVPGSALGAEIHRRITHRPSMGGDSHTAA